MRDVRRRRFFNFEELFLTPDGLEDELGAGQRGRKEDAKTGFRRRRIRPATPCSITDCGNSRDGEAVRAQIDACPLLVVGTVFVPEEGVPGICASRWHEYVAYATRVLHRRAGERGRTVHL
ncbi:MAG: hypothetical protein AVDCRST_MAG25-338 [uncultured Rubrobacteraceae bacterium]|uniref:Uncharacterized protein n=1 Tax=uncultured Rubrobacteraceae bacterium TaxID=349277 RepID=A0A6J4R775_9ACTN|nr:MAG: hypothetical protein AVDCRST_MAG25-338 [uncultured Rubrobacteraceae bacterium]